MKNNLISGELYKIFYSSFPLSLGGVFCYYYIDKKQYTNNKFFYIEDGSIVMYIEPICQDYYCKIWFENKHYEGHVCLYENKLITINADVCYRWEKIK